MTRYRLPEELCGADYEPVGGSTHGTAIFDIPGVGRVTMPFSALTEVKSAPPPEPPEGSVVVDRDDDAWQKGIEGWYHGNLYPRSWATLNENYGPLTRLVPDPFAEPVELPWDPNLREEADITKTSVYAMPDGYVHDCNTVSRTCNTVRLNPADARLKARALWAAADQAEAKS